MTHVTCINITKELHEKLRLHKEETGQSFSHLIRKLLTEFFEGEEK